MPIVGICEDAFGTYFLTYCIHDIFLSSHNIYLSNLINKHGYVQRDFTNIPRLCRREAIQIAKRFYPNCEKYEVSSMGHKIIKKIK